LIINLKKCKIMKNPFRKNVVFNPMIDNTNCYKVYSVNDGAENLSEALGISEERYAELKKLATRAFMSNDSVSNTLVEASKEIKNANEFALLILSISEVGQQLSMIKSFGGMFKK